VAAAPSEAEGEGRGARRKEVGSFPLLSFSRPAGQWPTAFSLVFSFSLLFLQHFSLSLSHSLSLSLSLSLPSASSVLSPSVAEATRMRDGKCLPRRVDGEDRVETAAAKLGALRGIVARRCCSCCCCGAEDEALAAEAAAPDARRRARAEEESCISEVKWGREGAERNLQRSDKWRVLELEWHIA
jgi:hypothetical protein